MEVGNNPIKLVNINQGRNLEIYPVDTLVDFDDPFFMEYYYRDPEMYRANVEDIIDI